MSLGLRLTKGSATPIDLTDGVTCAVKEHALTPGSLGAAYTTETIRLRIMGGKVAIQYLVDAIEEILQQAISYNDQQMQGVVVDALDEPVYLERRQDDSEEYYRSEITRASVSITAQALLHMDWIDELDYVIDLERRNYWEGPETQVPLSNHLGTDNTTGLTIYNPSVALTANTISFTVAAPGIPPKIWDAGNGLAGFKTGDTIYVRGSASNDGTYTLLTGGMAGVMETNEVLVAEAAGDDITIIGAICNYVDIDGDDVAGGLPAATRLEITNTYATGRLGDVWIGQNYTHPDTFDHILEAEEATIGGAGVATDTALASGGKYVVWTLASGVETTLLSWALSSAYLTAAAGRYFKILVQEQILTPNVNVRYRIKVNWNGTTIWQSGLATLPVTGGSQTLDLFTAQLPPWLPGVADLDGITLVLTGYQTTGVGVGIGIDFVQITPVDGWRFLDYIGYGVANGSRLVDDGINEIVYRDNGAGANKVQIHVPHGQAIMLQPGRDQRLYFLLASYVANTAEIDRTASIKLYYRPRRLTI